MADNRGFFAQLLGGMRPQAPVAPPSAPYGYLVPPQPQPLQYQDQQQQGYPQQQTQQEQYDGRAVMAALKSGQIDQEQALRLGLSHPKAFFTAKAGETGHCPECGDNRFFSRNHLRDKRTGMAPAPLCMACGYAGSVFDGEGHGTIGERYVDPNLPEVN